MQNMPLKAVHEIENHGEPSCNVPGIIELEESLFIPKGKHDPIQDEIKHNPWMCEKCSSGVKTTVDSMEVTNHAEQVSGCVETTRSLCLVMERSGWR